FVVRHDERGTLHGLDDFRGGIGLAASGHTQQRLVLEPVLDALDELGNRLRLITRGLVVGFQYEGLVFHSLILWCAPDGITPRVVPSIQPTRRRGTV